MAGHTGPWTRRALLRRAGALVGLDWASRWLVATARAHVQDGGHTGTITSVRFRHDGRQVASTATGDHEVLVWDPASGEIVHRLPHRFVSDAVFGPSGTLLATAGYEADEKQGSMIVWDVSTGAKTATWLAERWEARPPAVRAPLAPALTVKSLAFAPDGKTLAFGTTEGTVSVCDLSTGKVRHVLRQSRTAQQRMFKDYSTVHDLAFRPDGALLATALTHDQADLWDVDTGQRRFELKGHSSLVAGVAWSPDGKRLASVSMDKTGIIWDAATGERRVTLEWHTGAIDQVAYRPDGARILTSGSDGAAIVWDAVEGQPLRVINTGTDFVPHAAYRPPQGGWIGTCADGHDAAIWDPETGESVSRLTGHQGVTCCLAWSPDGRLVATGSTDTTIRLWDAATGRCLHVLGKPRAGE